MGLNIFSKWRSLLVHYMPMTIAIKGIIFAILISYNIQRLYMCVTGFIHPEGFSSQWMYNFSIVHV